MTTRQLKILLQYMGINDRNNSRDTITVQEFKKIVKDGKLRNWYGVGKRTEELFKQLFRIKK